MPVFSLARLPYYIFVVVYMVFVAIIAFVSNTMSSGILSDVYLAIMGLALGLAGFSLYYMSAAQNSQDDDVDVTIGSYPVAKKYYYVAILSISAWRGFEGYNMNHNLTGSASVLGMIWLIASAVLCFYTWINYQSYKAKKPS